jgi:SAM-dependent methyltransferase
VQLKPTSKVLDLGCGNGRWAYYVASKAAFVEAVDPSDSVFAAAQSLSGIPNVRITRAEIENLPFPDASFDFVMTLGVLHHIPDTRRALRQCVEKLKPGGYFLVYLYYSLDNRGRMYRLLFRATDLVRRCVARLPLVARNLVSDAIAISVYLPLVLVGRFVCALGMHSLAERLPLSVYRDRSLEVMRNDARDRFGTPLERRFSRSEIAQMMRECGLSEISFSENPPYWHAISRRSAD